MTRLVVVTRGRAGAVVEEPIIDDLRQRVQYAAAIHQWYAHNCHAEARAAETRRGPTQEEWARRWAVSE